MDRIKIYAGYEGEHSGVDVEWLDGNNVGHEAHIDLVVGNSHLEIRVNNATIARVNNCPGGKWE
jgi:hypothetical protein